jgi:hypothetical protein
LAARYERAVVVEADQFFDFIASGRIEPWKRESHEQNAAVMKIVGDTAAAYADAGYFTIVEGIVIPRWFLTPLRAALQERGHAVAYAVLRAPLDLCISRRPLFEPDVIASVWRQFDDLDPVATHALEVADATPDALADELADGLGERFLLSP